MLWFLKDRTGDEIIWLLVIWKWCIMMWRVYLKIRQRALVKRQTEVPHQISQWVTQETFDRSRRYQNDIINLDIFGTFMAQVVGTMLMFGYGLRFVWDLSGSVCHLFLPVNIFLTFGDILQSGLAMILISFYQFFNNLSYVCYRDFLESVHGFKVSNFGLMLLKGMIKGRSRQIINDVFYHLCMLLVVMKLPFYYIIIFLVELAFAVTQNYYPLLFSGANPWEFNLQPGPLRDGITQLCAQVDFPVQSVFIVGGMPYNSHSNAYFCGIGKSKKIIIFANLLENQEAADHEWNGCTTDEVVGIVSHELGHWKMQHNFKNMIITQSHVIWKLMLYAALRNYTPIYDAFGFHDCQPVVIGIYIILYYILAPLNFLNATFKIMHSRYIEFQADKFAKDIGNHEIFAAGITKLDQASNLTFCLSDWWYSIFYQDHPALITRLDRLYEQDNPPHPHQN